jgi:tetratricopeptide (TPR) repeat protein
MRRISVVSCALCIWLIFAQPLHSQALNAKAEFDLGLAAYEEAKIHDAIEHLERAVALDPEAKLGHYYLAKACEDAYIESESFPENDRLSARAIQEYEWLMKKDPSDTDTMKALGHRHYISAHFDDAERYYRKVLEIDGNDAETLYTIAIIQWTRSYQVRQEKRSELKLSRREPLIQSPACHEIRNQNLARVEEAIDLLTQVNQVLRATAAMRYMSIALRERADIQCGDRSAYQKDMKTALEWDRRACETSHSPDETRIPTRWPPAPPPPPPGQPGACPD